MNRLIRSTLVAAALLGAPLSSGAQEAKFVVKPLVEKKVEQLPAGPLFWRLENFPTLEKAQAAVGTHSLAAEAGGKVWLFTLGAPGGATEGGSKVAEVGPLPPVVAKTYLLRINEGSGAPGTRTPPHSHPGSEAFYVLKGETSSHTPHGLKRVPAGKTETGHGADTPMQVSSSGTTDLHSLVMFVVDADKPFSAPVKFP